MLKRSTSRSSAARQLSVAFQGELGAYSQGAVYKYFGKRDVRVLPMPTIQTAFDSLFTSSHRERSDLAVVPIENSTAGSVGETFDHLLANDVRIVGEVSLSVRHCLIAGRRTRLSQIRKVMSHPQALSQCRNYLSREGRGWQQIPMYDTAGSVKAIAKLKSHDTAAIASELASEIYSMKVLKRGIEDDPTNTTRFVVVEPRGAGLMRHDTPSGRDKTTIIFLIRHQPGSLVRALRCFSDRGINLLKIESRPIRRKPWEYSFYIDIDGHEKTHVCSQATKELKIFAPRVKVLGSYPRAERIQRAARVKTVVWFR